MHFCLCTFRRRDNGRALTRKELADVLVTWGVRIAAVTSVGDAVKVFFPNSQILCHALYAVARQSTYDVSDMEQSRVLQKLGALEPELTQAWHDQVFREGSLRVSSAFHCFGGYEFQFVEDKDPTAGLFMELDEHMAEVGKEHLIDVSSSDKTKPKRRVIIPDQETTLLHGPSRHYPDCRRFSCQDYLFHVYDDDDSCRTLSLYQLVFSSRNDADDVMQGYHSLLWEECLNPANKHRVPCRPIRKSFRLGTPSLHAFRLEADELPNSFYAALARFNKMSQSQPSRDRASNLAAVAWEIYEALGTQEWRDDLYRATRNVFKQAADQLWTTLNFEDLVDEFLGTEIEIHSDGGFADPFDKLAFLSFLDLTLQCGFPIPPAFPRPV